MNGKTFAKAFSYHLLQAGKTQQDIVNDLGFSSSTVSQWATGKTVPRMDRMEILAKYLRIDTSDFLRDPSIYDKGNFSTDPALVAKLLDSKPLLYELFKQAVPLQDTDLELLTGLAKRINELRG